MGIHRRHSITRRIQTGRRIQSERHGLRVLGVASIGIALLAPATGCRSGTTTFAAPSWWSFGGAGGTDPEKLATAPRFEGKSADGAITKPSQTATPYPTTTTPEGYSIAGATQGQAAGTVAANPPAEQSAITYGSPPPATQASAPPAMPASPAVSSTPAAPPANGPQVGPYASLPGAIPTVQNSQTLAPPPLTPSAGPAASSPLAGSSPGAFPATAGYEPATRMADAPAPSVSDPSAASRYAGSTSSRFGGGVTQAPAAAAAAPAAMPSPSPSTPPAAAPMSPGFDSPAAPPTSPAGGPPAPATRRPDPCYRPGGTSSYRPAQAILADDQPAAPSGVRTAAYEVPVSAAR
jgi:hypothetical protein